MGRWVAALVALTVLGMLVVLATTVDGRIASWSQRIAQNAADEAALAGANSLMELQQSGDFVCERTSDNLVLKQVQLYAELNQVPEAPWGVNVQAYYLSQATDGRIAPLIHPDTGQRWRVGTTGTVPCEAAHGLHVELYYPQETLITRLLAIGHAQVRIDATATWETTDWCRDFVVYGLDARATPHPVSITGTGLTIAGGSIYSGGTVFADVDTLTGLNPAAGERSTDTLAEQAGETASAAQPADFFYRLEDFKPGGFIWQMARNRHHLSGDLHSDIIAANGDGLYVTDGDVQFDALPPRPDGAPWHLTIVTEGSISVPAGTGADLEPYLQGVLLMSTSTDLEGAITLVENTNQLSGLIVAPDGRIKLDLIGDAGFSGVLAGYRVAIYGEGTTLRHAPAYCPPAPTHAALTRPSPEYAQRQQVSTGNGL